MDGTGMVTSSMHVTQADMPLTETKTFVGEMMLDLNRTSLLPSMAFHVFMMSSWPCCADELDAVVRTGA